MASFARGFMPGSNNFYLFQLPGCLNDCHDLLTVQTLNIKYKVSNNEAKYL